MLCELPLPLWRESKEFSSVSRRIPRHFPRATSTFGMYLWRSRNVDGSPLEYGLPYEDLYFVTDEKEPKTLNAWFVKQRGFKHCPTLIFLHGNAGNIGDRLQNVYGLYENVQCNIFLIDYRG